MKAINLLILAVFLSSHMVFAQEIVIKDNSQTTEKSYLILPKIQVIPIEDTKTKRMYELYVKLPEDYSKNKDKEYPIIYFTDALWHVEILSGSTDFLMKNAILVGISWEKNLKGELAALGAHASRFRDYLVQPSNNPEIQAKYQLGQASNHLTFVRNDVIKFIEKNYRADSSNRTYFGYSAGGLFGVYILLAQPNTFKNYILGSPSVKGDVQYFTALGSDTALKHKNQDTNVFISYGNLEKKNSPYIDEIITLIKNKKDEHLSLEHQVIEGSHETAFPMTVVRGLRWLSNLMIER